MLKIGDLCVPLVFLCQDQLSHVCMEQGLIVATI